MKISFISYSDTEGGAAKAQFSLAKYMNESSGRVTLHALKIKTDDPIVFKRESFVLKIYSYISPFLNKLLLLGIRKKFRGKWSSFFVAYSPFKFDDVISKVVHFHWVAGGMINFSNFSSQKKNLFITLHDVWFYTAGCHINYGCTNYKKECKACPQSSSYFGEIIARFNFYLKKKFIQKHQPIFIAPSSFIFEQAKGSSLLSRQSIYLVPNLVDTKVFKPIKKSLARDILGLDNNDFIVLFIAKGMHIDYLKGYDRFVEIAEALHGLKLENLKCLIVGSSIAHKIKLDSICLGFIEDPITMNLIYAASDLTINASLFESFGLTALESIASGTPVIGYDSGGTVDIVKFGVSGYLYKSKDEIVNQIHDLYKNPDELNALSLSASKFAAVNFNPYEISNKMLEIYGAN